MEKLIKLAGNDELTLNNAQAKEEKVFDLLDVRETTRADYKYRIGLFLDFVEGKRFNRNSFLAFKRELAERMDLAISTKNKYLTTARVFLKELNRQGFLPADITQNIKTYKGDLLEVAQYTRHKSLEMLQVYNDNIKRQTDLPRYYETFKGVSF